MSGRIYERQSVSAGRYRTELVEWRTHCCFVGCAVAMIIVGAVLTFDVLPKEEHWYPAGSARLIPSASPSEILYDSQGAGLHFRDFTDFPTGSPTIKRLPTTKSMPTSPPTLLTLPPALLPTPEPTAPSIQ